MKVLLVYYTGTYNTRFLTDKLEARFTKCGHSVDRIEINCETKPVDTAEYDLIGFSYPIYGFNAPGPFTRYMKKMTVHKGQKFFIYKNSGETLAMNNASSRVLLRRMKHKKLQFCGEYHYVLPYNIHFKYDTAFVKQILEKNEKLLDIMMYNLENGVIKHIKSKFIYNFAAMFVRIVNIAGDINSFLYKVDKDKCINCMKCVNTCPEKNIRVNKKGKIKFGHNCDMCMRCSFFCPTDAIRIGFLEWWGWRVNGDYKLKEIEKDTTPVEPYITEKSEGFYKCFIKTFKEIDEEHARLFGTPESEVAVTDETVITDGEAKAE